MGRLILKIMIVLSICLLGGSVFSYYTLLYKQNNLLEPMIFVVEKGSSLNQIAKQLKDKGALESVPVFKVAARLAGQSTALKAGEYTLPPRASAKELLEILVGGRTTLRRVVIPEGKTSQQVYDMLMQTQGLLGELPSTPENGALLPETYTYSYGMPRKVLAERMKSDMQKTIEELWPERDEGLPYKTIQEALVMASIVEKETSIGEERARIAAVFINRLRKGMRLQTDPTVIYAVTEGTMELKRQLTLKDLRTPHPFNTYTNAGLPPAPICNPGRDSIYAVLHPLKTDEFYFVADGTGGHQFAKTYEQHKRNIQNWRNAKKKKALARRKAKKKPVAPQPSIKAKGAKTPLSKPKTTEKRANVEKAAQTSSLEAEKKPSVTTQVQQDLQQPLELQQEQGDSSESQELVQETPLAVIKEIEEERLLSVLEESSLEKITLDEREDVIEILAEKEKSSKENAPER